MKLTFDPSANVAYIRLRERAGEVESVRVSDELVIDLDSEGRIYGIELLNANEQLRAADAGKLIVEGAASGARQVIELAK